MYSITKKFETETAHRLLDYSGKCAHLHGHRYQWEITLTSSTLIDPGFVIDFKDLKAVIKLILDPYDHAIVLHQDDPILNTALGVDILCASNGQSGRVILLPCNPTVENLTRIVGEEFVAYFDHHCGATIEVTKVKCHETTDSYAEWVPLVEHVGMTD